MNPDTREIDTSRVMCLLEELEGKALHQSWWDGYHPKVYNCGGSKRELDVLVAELCAKLRKLENTDPIGITKYSLEMQIWWRDHQKADKEREEKEAQSRRIKALKDKALAKLTKEERKLLGL